MRPLVILLFLLLWNTSYSTEVISDHLSGRWEGQKWIPNRLVTPQLAVNAGFFPMLTAGTGMVKLSGEPEVLRFHLYIETGAPNQTLFRLLGRVTETKNIPLAEMVLTNGSLALICFANPEHDSLFDCSADVVMPITVSTNLWVSREILINPLPYQQAFGWQDSLPQPRNPGKDKPPFKLLRQPSKVPWKLQSLQILPLKKAWFGGFEFEKDIQTSHPGQFNILRGPS